MPKKLALLIIVSAFSMSLIACGGNEEMASHDDMEEMETAAPTSAGSTPTEAPMEMLGGGHATLVHEGAGGSPHVNVHWGIDDANINITYGRPFLRDRVVGESVPPMADAVWRLGADEATTLATDTDLMIGDAHVPAGEYTLWTAHMGGEFHLIINSETGQWGTAYNGDNDLAHVAMEVGELSTPAEQLVISVTEDSLGFDWGAMTASVSLMVH